MIARSTYTSPRHTSVEAELFGVFGSGLFGVGDQPSHAKFFIGGFSLKNADNFFEVKACARHGPTFWVGTQQDAKNVPVALVFE